MLRSVFLTIILLSASFLVVGSAKPTVSLPAAQKWTKKQRKAFCADCEKKATKRFSDDKAKAFCKCATNEVVKQVETYEEARDLPLLDILKLGKDCL